MLTLGMVCGSQRIQLAAMGVPDEAYLQRAQELWEYNGGIVLGCYASRQESGASRLLRFRDGDFSTNAIYAADATVGDAVVIYAPFVPTVEAHFGKGLSQVGRRLGKGRPQHAVLMEFENGSCRVALTVQADPDLEQPEAVLDLAPALSNFVISQAAAVEAEVIAVQQNSKSKFTLTLQGTSTVKLVIEGDSVTVGATVLEVADATASPPCDRSSWSVVEARLDHE